MNLLNRNLSSPISFTSTASTEIEDFSMIRTFLIQKTAADNWAECNKWFLVFFPSLGNKSLLTMNFMLQSMQKKRRRKYNQKISKLYMSWKKQKTLYSHCLCSFTKVSNYTYSHPIFYNKIIHNAFILIEVMLKCSYAKSLFQVELTDQASSFF